MRDHHLLLTQKKKNILHWNNNPSFYLNGHIAGASVCVQIYMNARLHGAIISKFKQPKTVGNIGLSLSQDSIHQAKRPSRRSNASRHHPHRSSSRRNKENGASRSGSFRKHHQQQQQQQYDDIIRMSRKTRAVSFDQPQLPLETSTAAAAMANIQTNQNTKLCDRNKSDSFTERINTIDVDVDVDVIDGVIGNDRQTVNDSTAKIDDTIMGYDHHIMDVSLQSTQLDHHFKPPRV